MLSKLPLIGRVLGIGLGLVGVVLFIMVAVNENNAPGFVSFGMISTILGIIIAVLSFVLALVVNPQGIHLDKKKPTITYPNIVIFLFSIWYFLGVLTPRCFLF